MKRILFKTGLFAAGIVFFALCVEVSLRIVGRRYVTVVPETEASARGAYTVLCIGDSFTYGAGAPPESSYPKQLEALLRARFKDRAFKVVNAGEVGQNTAQVLWALPGLLDKVRPACVVMLSGGANYWNYWGYRSGREAARDPFYERIRLVRLGRLLKRSEARALSAPVRGPAFRQCNDDARKAGDSAAALRKAIASCERAIADDDRDTVSMSTLGMLFVNSGNPEEGLRHLKKAVEIDPGDNRLYSSISVAYNNMRNKAEADKWLKRGAIASGGSSAESFSGSMDIGAWVKRDIEEFVDILAARKIRLIIQNYPAAEEDRELTRQANAILRTVASARAVPFVDQAAVFDRLLKKGSRDDYFARKDCHCSANGYGVMAAQIADELERSGGIRERD